MSVGIGLHGDNALIRACNLEHRILIAVEMYKASSLRGGNANLYIRIGQTGAVVAETNGDEISLAPILYKGFGIVIVILQRACDLPPANAQAFLNVSYGR